jgi:hypothetical protein
MAIAPVDPAYNAAGPAALLQPCIREEAIENGKIARYGGREKASP